MNSTIFMFSGRVLYIRTFGFEVFMPKIRFLHFWTDELRLKRAQLA